MPDIANNIRTRTELEIGTPYSSSIERARDVDFFKVELEAGESYTISLSGDDVDDDPLSDPVLTLRNSRGRVLATNDDVSTANQDSLIEFEPTTDGVYYVVASGYGRLTGDYLLEVEVAGAEDDEEMEDEEEEEEDKLVSTATSSSRNRAGTLASLLSDGSAPLSTGSSPVYGKGHTDGTYSLLAG